MDTPEVRAESVAAGRRLPKAFILGCAKSGTTWAQNLLGGHDQAAVAGEGAFAWRLAPVLLQAVKVFNEGQIGSGQPESARIDEAETVDLLRAAMDLRWGRYVRESGAWRDGEPSRLRIVCDKTPQHTVGVRLLESLYPGSRYVHMVRDPRDAAVSAWFHFGKREGKTFEQFVCNYIGVVWPTNVQTARRDAPPLGERWLEVRYEDMLEDAPRQAARMLAHLGLDTHDAALSACLRAGSFKERSGGREPGEADAASFYRRGVAGDWREHIEPSLAERACRPVAALMSACGYEPASAAGSGRSGLSR